MRKIKSVVIIVALIPILIIDLDLLNITNIIPLTSKYDWLGFLGAYISGICTLVLGIISIKQNDTLSNVNKKMLDNDMIANCFSKIDIERVNYFDATEKEYNKEVYGLKMVNIDKDNKKNHYHKIILQIKDNNNLPLVSAKIEKLEIEFDYNDELFTFRKKNTYYSNDSVILEVTPHNDKITYYLPICILDDVKYLKSIYNNKEIRVIAQISIKNSFNVVSNGEYTLVLSKGNKASEDWTEYSLRGRKIYFNKIEYKDE